MMHGLAETASAAPTDPVLVVLTRGMALCNRVIVALASVALIAACVILS